MRNFNINELNFFFFSIVCLKLKKTVATVELIDKMISRTQDYLVPDIADVYAWEHDESKTSRRAKLIRTLQTEGIQLYCAKEENQQLKSALEEHQMTLQFVMDKYRSLKQSVNQAKMKYPLPDHLTLDDQEIALNRQMDKITEMRVIMAKAVQIDENFDSKDKKLIDKLVKENITLRKLLTTQEDKQDKNEERDEKEEEKSQPCPLE